MEEIKDFVKNKIGVDLSQKEIKKIHIKYFDLDKKEVDFERLLKDLVKIMKKDSIGKSKSFEEVVNLISSAVMKKLEYMKGEHLVNKTYSLFKEKTNPDITLDQLMYSCKYKLGIDISKSDAEIVFLNLDPRKTGTISVRRFINIILRKAKLQENNDSLFKESLNKSSHSPKVMSEITEIKADDDLFVNNPLANSLKSNSIKDFIKEIITRTEPSGSQLPKFQRIGSQQLKEKIKERIYQRTGADRNMTKTFLKLFQDSNEKRPDYISFESLKNFLTLKLKLEVHDDDIQNLILAMGNNASNQVSFFKFVNEILGSQKVSNPFLDNSSPNTTVDMVLQNPNFFDFFLYLRNQINRLINKESRAPHYLLHCANKMSRNQAYVFFSKKLGLNIHDYNNIHGNVVNELFRLYSDKGNIDVKKILLIAMSVKEAMRRDCSYQSKNFPNKSLLNGAFVTIDGFEPSLRNNSLTVEQIERLIREKCNQRQKNGFTFSNLSKYFRESREDPWRLSRHGLKAALEKFDIILSKSEFDALFEKHKEASNNNIDIRSFFKSIFPTENNSMDPLIQKDSLALKEEEKVVKVLNELTGVKREIENLNGTFQLKFNEDFIKDLNLENNEEKQSSKSPEINAQTLSQPSLKPIRSESFDNFDNKDTFSYEEKGNNSNLSSKNRLISPNIVNINSLFPGLNTDQVDLSPPKRPKSAPLRSKKNSITDCNNIKTPQIILNHFENERPLTSFDEATTSRFRSLKAGSPMIFKQDTKFDQNISSPDLSKRSSSNKRPTSAPPSRSYYNKSFVQKSQDKGIYSEPNSPFMKSKQNRVNSANSKPKSILSFSNRTARLKYKFALENITTSHQEYGLFVKKL